MPDSRIYHIACEGAHAVGMYAITFSENDQAIRDLEEHLSASS
jgi:hypothetical protein